MTSHRSYAFAFTAISFAATFTLAGCCGGGGGSSEPTSTPTPTPKADGCAGAFRDASGTSCTCSKDQFSGSVWGTGIYTADSSICNAARHAGAVDAKGGKVEFKKTKGCPSYTGSKKNGVSSSKWGSYDPSYYFPGHGDGKCVGGDSKACAGAFRDMKGESFTCNCSKDQFSGSVWGTGIYTADSSICNAALHAGAVDAEGGEVKVKKTKGCSKYTGSKENGVSSSSWGSYDPSYYFDGKGDGKCAE